MYGCMWWHIVVYYVLLKCSCVASFVFFFSSRRRHTSCALVTGVQTCALPIFPKGEQRRLDLMRVQIDAGIEQRLGKAIYAIGGVSPCQLVGVDRKSVV